MYNILAIEIILLVGKNERLSIGNFEEDNTRMLPPQSCK